MASDLYIHDGSLFSDPFSLFSIDLDPSIFQTPFDETNNHTNQMENLSLTPYFEAKTEENQLSLSSDFAYHSYNNGSENVTKFMQRSFSSNNYSFEACFDPVTESANFHPQICENGYSNIGQMRRVCSTGDLQSKKTLETRHQLSSSPLGTQSSYIEEANSIKVGRYNAEERKERIIRYKAKRTQRNFNKTIKYACRKTLADNRPRIRGRFARHDEPEETSKTATSSGYEEDYDLWNDGFNVQGEEGIREEGSLFNILGYGPFKYFGY